MIEHKCTSRECGKVEVFDDMAVPERPAHCTACGRAVIETWLQNPVRVAKRSLLRRAMDAVTKQVDKEIDEVSFGDSFFNALDKNKAAKPVKAAVDACAGALLAGKTREEAHRAYCRALLASEATQRIDGKHSGLGASYDSAFDKQEGGAHYKDFEIQPAEFILANGLGFVEGNVIKYVCRHRAKNGAEDLRKAIHYIELLLESEYGEARNGND